MSKKPSPDAARHGIESAYRSLNILPGKDYRITEMIEEMTGFPPCAEPVPAFTVVGRNSTAKELTELADKAMSLVRAIEALHSPAIDALADQGSINKVQQLKRLAKQVEQEVRSVDVSNVPERQGGGRPVLHLPLGIAMILASNFQELTGGPPTIIVDWQNNIAQGQFLDFVESVFDALGVPASAEVMAKKAIAKRKKNAEEAKQKERDSRNEIHGENSQ